MRDSSLVSFSSLFRIVSSTTNISCLSFEKLKFSGLNRLPITVIAKLVKIDVRFPANKANMSDVDVSEISPDTENAYPSQTVTPHPYPIIAAAVAT